MAGSKTTIERDALSKATSDALAEARATALSLRASAKACGPEQGALKFRLMRAAESLDAMVLLAVHSIERIEQLEQELRQLKGGVQ